MNAVASSRLLAKQQQIYRINLGYTAENRMDVTPVNRSVTLSAINRRSIPFNLSKPIGQYMHRQLEHRNYALCTHYVVMYSIRFVRQFSITSLHRIQAYLLEALFCVWRGMT